MKNPVYIHIYQDETLAKQLSEELKTRQVDCLMFTSFVQAFNALDESVMLITISANTLSQDLSVFFRRFKDSPYRQIPAIALLDTSEQTRIKNSIKMGYADYLDITTPINQIAQKLCDIHKNMTTNSSLSKVSAAVIDDDPLHLLLMERFLQKNGLQKITCYSSAEAFLKNPIHYDLFLVDLVLQNISGIQLVAQLRKSYPDARIVVSSSLNEEKIVTTALEQGADDFLGKPISAELLKAKLNAFFRTA